VRESFETTTESDRPVPRKKEFSLKAGLERKVGWRLNNEVKGLTFMLGGLTWKKSFTEKADECRRASHSLLRVKACKGHGENVLSTS